MQGFRMSGFTSVLVQEGGIGSLPASLAKMLAVPLWFSSHAHLGISPA